MRTKDLKLHDRVDKVPQGKYVGHSGKIWLACSHPESRREHGACSFTISILFIESKACFKPSMLLRCKKKHR